ncbi:PTS sugar transporter subunit IIA [Thermophilibacter sp.]
MNQIVLASHGGLATGMRDSLEMIVGAVPRVHTITLERDDTDQVGERARALIESFGPDDKVYVLTDMLGSSVSNQMVELHLSRPDVTVISGMNLPLVIELALAEQPVSAEALAMLIEQGRSGIQDVSVLMGALTQSEEDDDL